ncbi:hypothetical protein KSP39_PZI006078 [Platanthera zijinensis]|uniref:Uncharacterized protein n=1 Tax=Platanthera zijinensis TaxID=2320716 RepID=A0AAP0BTD6_9ASPA
MHIDRLSNKNSGASLFVRQTQKSINKPKGYLRKQPFLVLLLSCHIALSEVPLAQHWLRRGSVLRSSGYVELPGSFSPFTSKEWKQGRVDYEAPPEASLSERSAMPNRRSASAALSVARRGSALRSSGCVVGPPCWSPGMTIAGSEIREWVYTSSTPDADTMVGSISGIAVSLTLDTFFKIFGLVNGEEDINLESFEYEEMLTLMGYCGDNPNKLLKKHLSAGYKFLANVVGKVLLGKHTAHDHITRQQFLVMSAVVNKKAVNCAKILFNLIKKKNNKKEVCFGRILGIFFNTKATESLVAPTIFINASKRLTCALFGRWERTIPKPSKASSSKTSESTRAVPTTPHPAEESSIPSLDQTLSSSLQQISSAPASLPIPPASPIHPASLVHQPTSPQSPIISSLVQQQQPLEQSQSPDSTTPPLSPFHIIFKISLLYPLSTFFHPQADLQMNQC